VFCWLNSILLLPCSGLSSICASFVGSCTIIFKQFLEWVCSPWKCVGLQTSSLYLKCKYMLGWTSTTWLKHVLSSGC
jgi:hypothetical protein